MNDWQARALVDDEKVAIATGSAETIRQLAAAEMERRNISACRLWHFDRSDPGRRRRALWNTRHNRDAPILRLSHTDLRPTGSGYVLSICWRSRFRSFETARSLSIRSSTFQAPEDLFGLGGRTAGRSVMLPAFRDSDTLVSAGPADADRASGAP